MARLVYVGSANAPVSCGPQYGYFYPFLLLGRWGQYCKALRIALFPKVYICLSSTYFIPRKEQAIRTILSLVFFKRQIAKVLYNDLTQSVFGKAIHFEDVRARGSVKVKVR